MTPRRLRGDDGAGLAMLLVSLVVLGILVVIALSTHVGTSPVAAQVTGPSGITGVSGVVGSSGVSGVSGQAGSSTSLPSTITSVAADASRVECESDFTALQTAVLLYGNTNGTPPPAGTAWATAATHGGPYIQSWPTQSGFTISWNGTVLSVTPTKGTPSRGTMGTANPRTGCYDA